MRKFTLMIGLPILLAGCEEANPVLMYYFPTTEVEVQGRTWRVNQTVESPPAYRAIRKPMGESYQPFGPPSTLKTTQAIAAIEKASGCRVNPDIMYRTVSDVFYARVVCDTQ